MGAIDERFGQVELAALDEVVGECLQYLLQHPVIHPTLEAPKTRRVRWISVRHVGPRRAGPQDPQNSVEHIAWISPWSPASVFTHLWLRKKLFDCRPLLIGEVHLDLRSQTVREVDPRTDSDLISRTYDSTVYEMRSSRCDAV